MRVRAERSTRPAIIRGSDQGLRTLRPGLADTGTIVRVDPGGVNMSYELECIVPGCEGKVEGETFDKVFQLAGQHGAEVHGLTELDEATVEAVKAAIVEKG